MNEQTPPVHRAQMPAGELDLMQLPPAFLQRQLAALETVFRITFANVEVAQTVTLPALTAKLNELKHLYAKESDLQKREQKWAEDIAALESIKTQLAKRETDLAAAQEAWAIAKENQERDREASDYRFFVDPTHYLLPSVLLNEDARSFVQSLVTQLARTELGWKLRATLAAAALSEASDDPEAYLKAIQDIYPVALAFETESKVPIISALKLHLSYKAAKIPIAITIPTIGEKISPMKMHGTSESGNVTRVERWGVSFQNKERERKAVVA